MNVGSSFTEMVHANTTRVQVGRSSATGYYLKVLTSSGYGEQGAQNGSYYHHSTDRGIFYWEDAVKLMEDSIHIQMKI